MRDGAIHMREASGSLGLPVTLVNRHGPAGAEAYKEGLCYGNGRS